MKKFLKKIRLLIPKTTKYFFDFFVVFIGVFLAFWLNARKETQDKKEEEVQIYRAVYEDLNAFYVSGREENERGFINLFQNYKKDLDSLISIKKIPANKFLYGDYWHLEIINSLSNSDKLANINAELFKGLANFNTSHQMFLHEIEGFNTKYENYVTADYEKGMDYFYKPDSNEPKEKIKIIQNRLDRIISLAKMLVENTETAKNGLQEEFDFK
ncbi:hypothetical protein [Leeuwenhoekiella parthenopeia]|uniref:Uncharacterized protein n=1 Tax=Leeuwenhoekiella parthenopeia TaxID=2890320 RepID=A0ABS8GUE5_9FLAO|nr:hypothetical protein [Leeuwenhoekiella parthenopeia]MCC4213103.1 hypothetical protein [Leeuwenhoekiella parthenopeia]